MNKESEESFIDLIVKQSKNSSKELQENISILIDSYTQQKKQIEKLTKENNFFVKKWDKQNILMHQRDAKKDKLLEQQSRLASMGEMIDAVAHQWKQPLNSISMLIELLKIDFEQKNVDNNYINSLENNMRMQIDHMVNTLSEFRNFLHPSTKSEDFFIHSVLSKVLLLMQDELLSQNIHIHTNFDHEVTIYGNKNEFKHLFLNLINNSIDAFNEHELKQRDIYIRCYRENEKTYIEVEDNAGGIPQNIINKIFKPNVTSKPEGKGTGIGLYMSKQIVKKNSGNINVHNSDIGAFFTIIFS